MRYCSTTRAPIRHSARKRCPRSGAFCRRPRCAASTSRSTSRCRTPWLRRSPVRDTACVRAIVLNSLAGPDGLELAQVPDPTPRDGEQLVTVRAASLGPWDRSSTEGAFAAMGGSSEFPQVQGWDFAGETIDGRRVLGFVPQPWMGVGAFAEQIAVPSAILAPLPEALGFPEGSTLPVCGLTARLLVEAAAVSGGAG